MKLKNNARRRTSERKEKVGREFQNETPRGQKERSHFSIRLKG